MAYYVVSDTSLTGIADKIRAKGGTSASLSFPTGFESAIDAIPISFTELYSGEITDSYSSTTAATLTTISLGSSAYTADGILYVQVRDKAGKRDGYFYGTDSFIYNRNPIVSPSTAATISNNESGGLTITFRTSASSHNIASYSNYVGYGIYPYSIATDGVLTMRHRYNSSYSLTINGTFSIKVYLVTGPLVGWYDTGS